jgi:hypothetical protein
VCRECGAEEKNYAAGRCARCVLAERLQELADGGDRQAVARLEPYLDALREGSRPWSVLNWMGVSAGYRTLAGLVRGELELSHDGLDTVGRGQSTSYLRAALVSTDVLPARFEHTAMLDAFVRARIGGLAEGEDRTQLRAFAIWQAGHDLHRRERHGLTTRSSHKAVRTQISVAADLIGWLHADGLTLRSLRQQHLDLWLAEGSSTRRWIRAFLKWAHRGGLVPALEVPAHEPRNHTDPLDAEQRLRIVGTLLTTESVDLRDRVAGSLLLIFAQPVTRIAKLTIDDILMTIVPSGSGSAAIPSSSLNRSEHLPSSSNTSGQASRQPPPATVPNGSSRAFGSTRRSTPSSCAGVCNDWGSPPGPPAPLR